MIRKPFYFISKQGVNNIYDPEAILFYHFNGRLFDLLEYETNLILQIGRTVCTSSNLSLSQSYMAVILKERN